MVVKKKVSSKSLYQLAKLSRSIYEFKISRYFGIRRKRYFYIFFFSLLLIIVCLSYGNIIDIRKYWKIDGQEYMVAIFCFMNIAASVYILNLKKDNYTIKGFIKLDEIRARTEINKLKREQISVLKSWPRELAGPLLTIVSVLFVVLLTHSNSKDNMSLMQRLKEISNDSDLILFSYSIFFLTFVVGNTIGSPYFPGKYRRRQQKIDCEVRNIFIDNLTISKLNPDLNE